MAVVVDPIRSMTNQKIDIGAFRVYPRGYKASKCKILKYLFKNKETIRK